MLNLCAVSSVELRLSSEKKNANRIILSLFFFGQIILSLFGLIEWHGPLGNHVPCGPLNSIAWMKRPMSFGDVV